MTLTLTDNPDQARRFPTQMDAMLAGEEFCHENWLEHSRSLVNEADVGDGWVAEIWFENVTDHPAGCIA